ncbi:MAG: 50S ribosomal protein L24 [Candidatus Midichloria sp.]|nr:MAG: 50S ribosomal protein L24 [Candidatus Midichloria sp.]
MTSRKFRRDDEVFVIAGKDKGKKGKIIKVIPDRGKVIVSGINVAKKHMKPNKRMPSGGIIPKEMPIDISNLSHIDPKSEIPTRVGFKFLEGGEKVRYAKKSGELIDKI